MILLLVSLGEFGIFYALAMPGLHSNEVLYFDYTSSGVANQVLGQISPSSFNGRSTREQRTTNSGGICDENICSSADGSSSSDSRDASTNGTKPVSPCQIPSLNPLQNYELGQTYQLMMQTAPIAVVDLFSNHDFWEHYHPDIIPQPKKETHVLKSGAPHFLEVILDLPESETNTGKIGMFSVVVDLHSSTTIDSSEKTAKLLASSTRTARMPHESVWISVVRKAVCILPHLLGAIPESRKVVVNSYRFFTESEEFPLRYVTVRLLVSPQKAQEGDMIEVTHGMLRIGEELTGMRLVLKEWFFVCAGIGTLLFFSVQSLIFYFLKVCWNHRSGRQEEEQEHIILDDDISESLGLDGLDGSHAEDNNNGDSNDRDHPHENSNNSNNNFEQRSSSQRHRSGDFDFMDEDQDEWEDLPQESTEANPPQNESHDPETVGEQHENESRHWIPEN